MPDVPQMIFDDASATAGTSSATNDAMPRMGGFADPGSEMFVKWDDMAPQRVEVDPDGMWDYSVPELQNGDHEFEMWTRDPATGEVSDSMEFGHTVEAGEADRAWQRERNRDWDANGREEWREDNRRFRDSVGQGGGGGGGKPPGPRDGGQKPEDPAGSGLDDGVTRTGGSQTPGGGGGGGSQPPDGDGDGDGGGGDGEQWLEKGNTPG